MLTEHVRLSSRRLISEQPFHRLRRGEELPLLRDGEPAEEIAHVSVGARVERAEFLAPLGGEVEMGDAPIGGRRGTGDEPANLQAS